MEFFVAVILFIICFSIYKAIVEPEKEIKNNTFHISKKDKDSSDTVVEEHFENTLSTEDFQKKPEMKVIKNVDKPVKTEARLTEHVQSVIDKESKTKKGVRKQRQPKKVEK